MNKPKLFWIGAVMVVAVAPTLLAQPGPPTRTERGEGTPPWRRGESEPFQPARGYGGDMPTDQQWEEVSAFMAEHSQRRWTSIQSLADDRAPLRRRVWGRYLAMQQMRKDNPRLYETRLQQLRLEDKVFGLVEDYRLSSSVDERDKLRAQIRQSVAAWIGKGLDERQQRLDRLEQMIQQERDRLQDDRKRADAMVDERMEKVLVQGADALHPEGGPPPEHGPRRGPPPPGMNEGHRRDGAGSRDDQPRPPREPSQASPPR